MNNKVIIIGAGASGMWAAIAAKKAGADVTVIERNQAEGKKLSATGNGRCNFTNVNADNVQYYHSHNKAAVARVLSQFAVNDILNEFDALGITPSLEEDGKYFPLSGQASSVVDVLCRELKRNAVNIIYNTQVTDIDITNAKLTVITDNGSFAADKLIIATGGMAAPTSGSDGGAYSFAKKLGHTIVQPFPVIVQLKTKDGFYKRLNGLRINAEISLIVDGKYCRRELGDLMFYDYGLSGSTVFKLSCEAAYALSENKSVCVAINFAPGYTVNELKAYIAKRCTDCPYTAEEVLVGFVNKKLIQLLLEASSINKDALASELNEKQINALCRSISDMRFTVTGTKGWNNAQATAGGISLDEIDPLTLRSRFDERIGFCGEILDVAGECGGFNLTWAWASGHVCGSKILK